MTVARERTLRVLRQQLSINPVRIAVSRARRRLAGLSAAVDRAQNAEFFRSLQMLKQEA